MKRLIIKVFNYEYWPMWAFYLPLSFYFIFQALKHGKLFFFTNVNRNLDEYGGLFFDSKAIIDNKIPQAYRPLSVLCDKDRFHKDLICNFKFPMILKPDQGERGKGVKKVLNEEELNLAIDSFSEPFLIQEYVDYKMEFGVFVALNPVNLKYEIMSLARKHYFEIEGNGFETIRDLVKKSERGIVFSKELESNSNLDFNMILESGERRIVHTHGNHCKGTRFENINNQITNGMNRTFNNFLKGLDGFEYGRFDLKCESISDLETFEHIKIIEFNGLAAEPIVIYDSSVGYFNSLGIFIKHWKRLINISKFNRTRGIENIDSVKILKKIWRFCRD